MKAIAIPYIIAIVLGIVVVGVIGYQFFGLAGKGSGVSTQLDCSQKKLSFCQYPAFTTWDSSCGSQPSQQECSQIAGTSGSGSSSGSGETKQQPKVFSTLTAEKVEYP